MRLAICMMLVSAASRALSFQAGRAINGLGVNFRDFHHITIESTKPSSTVSNTVLKGEVCAAISRPIINLFPRSTLLRGLRGRCAASTSFKMSSEATGTGLAALRKELREQGLDAWLVATGVSYCVEKARSGVILLQRSESVPL